jgi:hypothetical protein
LHQRNLLKLELKSTNEKITEKTPSRVAAAAMPTATTAAKLLHGLALPGKGRRRRGALRRWMPVRMRIGGHGMEGSRCVCGSERRRKWN